ncbi:thiol peroxidase [Arachidicoccus terrestris]|uniref:thiol peroxidase n=1 Tax=Arachidicoccus terrestris TaxID=2875539 RepID=UPI001CC43AA4|nr:thiol peroxidase [Arachidicoccus terrestris]
MKWITKTYKLFVAAACLLTIVSCQQTPASKGEANKDLDTTAVSKENGVNNYNPSQKNTSFMTTIQFKGNPIHTVGALPQKGTEAPDFTLVGVDLSNKSLSDFKGKYVILNIFPSVNTGVCAASVRQFNKDAASVPNATVLCISKDLPFAQSQFCGAEGIENVVMLSDFRTDFGHQYGVQMADGPLQGLLSRAVVVINPEGKIIYEQQVPEITEEPNYEKALAAIQ